MTHSGRQLRFDGAKATLEAEHERWKAGVFNVIRWLVRVEPRGFSNDDIRVRVKSLYGEPHHPNCWGAIILAASKAKIIKGTGRIVQSDQTSRHAGMNREWVGYETEDA